MPTANNKTNKKPAAPQPFTSASPAEAYNHFLPLCQAIPAADVKLCNLDVNIVRHNVDRGVDAIAPHRATVAKKLPECPFNDVVELPSLALALIFAADRIPLPASDGQIAERLAALRPMRDLTLRQLEILADLRFAPANQVRAIRAGTGPIDAARDAVSIAALFQELGSAVAGKHPFSPEYFDEMRGHGEWLLKQLKPEGAVAAPIAADPAIDIRDRLWTMLSARHDHLREAGVVVYGLKALDEHVPPLGSRTITRSAPTAPASPNTP